MQRRFGTDRYAEGTGPEPGMRERETIGRSMSMFDDSDDGNDGLRGNPRDLDESVRKYREAIRRGRMDEVSHALSNEALETIVQYCLDAGKHDDALTFAAMLADAMPYSHEAWHKKGLALAGLRRTEDALECYRKA
ncbi:MAG: hypothetical protein ACKOAX_12010, partial [Candidatus Kapaibacterium sp.]